MWIYFNTRIIPPVLCRYLGYDGGVAILKRNRKSLFYLYVRHCSKKSLRSLAGCSIFQSSRCRNSFLLNCSYSQWQVRLNSSANGMKEREGTIEVYFNETWTVVCDDKWDINGAQVACRQLGFKKAITANSSRSKSTSGDKNNSKLEVLCNGNETTLRDCQHKIIHNQTCTTAAAVCQMNECERNDFEILMLANSLLFLDCPSGWFLYADYCYTISRYMHFMDELGWEEGGCGSSNSASITSPHEQAFVVSLLAGRKPDVWIGLRRKDNEAFEWINGDPLRCH